MKIPKIQRRHCPYCNKHTEHKVTSAKRRPRGSANPLGQFSNKRLRARGERRGQGGLGRYSKPAIKKWKMTGRKMTTKTDLRYECQECKKQHVQAGGIRTKKVDII
ncbi:MAG: 50S ribosomal protein L44e [Candidatus Woesearchaeota archaeon]